MKRRVLYLTLAIQLFAMHCTHATKLGHIYVNDPVQGVRPIIYKQVNQYAISEDDIIIAKLKSSSILKASIIYKLGGGVWADSVVPFELSEDLPVANKLAALQAITLWQQKSNVEFIELTSKNRDNYPDYISFIPASGTTCASFVGKQKGKQEIILAPRCNAMNTVHEIGHALGLWHEQSRIDRDMYVRIIWENIDEEHRYNFEQHLTDGKDFGEYDYQSIMHYPADAFSKNGGLTIIPLRENVEIGQRRHLTEKDIAAINSMYPRR